MSIATSLRSEFKKHTQNLPSFIITTSKHQQWLKRWYATVLPERVKLITSREMIKPLYPTPIDKKTVKFSLLDQLAPSLYNSILLFYQNDNNIEQTSRCLKESLSKTLVDFYPLAGRIKQNELIECNDQGVEFIEAHYSSENLVDFVESTNLVDLNALLPESHTTLKQNNKNNNVMSVQLNHFSCGGVAIGVSISHKITDGCAMVDFLNYWASNNNTTQFPNNTTNITNLPKFNGSSIFPPLKELNEKMFDPQEDFRGERIATRRLIFYRKTIDKLKSDEVIKTGIIRPTTNEVIVGFIWKQLQPKFSYVFQFVNIRKRMIPAVPEESFGNFLFFTRSRISDLGIMEGLRNSIRQVNHGYIKEMCFEDASLLKFKEKLEEMHMNRENSLLFSNLSKLGLYEDKFGMGKLVWVCLPSVVYKNFALIMPTKSGNGVEVWITMLEDDILILDHSLSKLGYPLIKPLI